MINRKLLVLMTSMLIFIIGIQLILAADWYKGDLHQHTGFSTLAGYPGLSGSNCTSESLDPLGYNISQLKDQIQQAGYDDYWLSITDHSYCLNSSEWGVIESDTQTHTDSNYTFLASEEVSVEEDCANWWDDCLLPYQSVGHLGAHGISGFIDTDGNEWCPEWPGSNETINTVNNDGGISIINHPYSFAWDWESLGIHGGSDCTSGETGIEIWNGDWGSADQEAKELWVNLTLEGGDKIFAYGGTDSHEDGFNPVVKNYVYLDSLNSSNLITTLKEGYSYVSNNGELYIEIKNPYSNTSNLGETLDTCDDDIVNITITYNIVLGYPCNLTIYKGEIGGASESPWNFGSVVGPNSNETQSTITTDSYFRAECINSTEDRRIFTNPIWVDLAPDVDGDGYCNLNDCDDSDGGSYPGATEYCDGVDNDCDDVIDEGCGGSEPEGSSYNCTESGYDQCAGYLYGDCNVSIAVNHYTNVNNIQWGAVDDSSDPYVIGNYTFGWKGVNVLDTYYEVNNPGPSGEDDCNYEDQCSGDHVADESTMATVYAPGTAFRENILGYNKNTSSQEACWTWFNPFSPSYGASNPIYVLNCFNESHCSSGYYCDKTGSWPDWDCVLKKGDGQNCTSDSQCSSGYCDNDGVGLSDDGVCFIPYNTYFDGQEPKYCEYSTGYGDVDCDEKEVGDGCGTDCKTSVYFPTSPSVLHPNGSETFDPNTNITINWTLSTDLDSDFIRYFLQYSNNSGVNWTNIISNYGYENKLNDSSTEKVLNFSGNENNTIYIRLPKEAKILYARLNLGGLPV